MSRNTAIAGEDSKPALEPIFCYAIRDDGAGQNFYLANYDTDITIEGMPAKWGGGDPQVFNSAQIYHSTIEKQNGLEGGGFSVQAKVADLQDFSRYLIFGMIPKIEVAIIKVSAGIGRDGSNAVWDRDTQVMHSGLASEYAVKEYQIQLDCKPEPMMSTHRIPRWRATRTCNHPLYSGECGVISGDFDYGNAITAIDQDNRQVTISGQRPGVNADHWRQGVLVHTPSGTRLTILAADHVGPDTVVQLHQWSPDLSLTDPVTLKAGCDHTAPTCELKFNNLENFGGFPLVPNKNINIHGVE